MVLIVWKKLFYIQFELNTTLSESLLSFALYPLFLTTAPLGRNVQLSQYRPSYQTLYTRRTKGKYTFFSSQASQASLF